MLLFKQVYKAHATYLVLFLFLWLKIIIIYMYKHYIQMPSLTQVNGMLIIYLVLLRLRNCSLNILNYYFLACRVTCSLPVHFYKQLFLNSQKEETFTQLIHLLKSIKGVRANIKAEETSRVCQIIANFQVFTCSYKVLYSLLWLYTIHNERFDFCHR